jgi:hypothetical protein
MSALLRMETARLFGFSNRATLNPALVVALHAQEPVCETCREIAKELDAIPAGAEFVECGSFPGKTVQKLDAHFKAHWKAEYELVDRSGRKDPV